MIAYPGHRENVRTAHATMMRTLRIGVVRITHTQPGYSVCCARVDVSA